MSLAKFQFLARRLDDAALTRHTHVFVVMPAAETLDLELPGLAQLQAVLSRRAMKVKELAKTPLAVHQQQL